VIDLGEGNRTLGATQMNATSSRSHTVVTVDFSKVTKMGGKEGRLKSMINIVDLAGSEKQN
jgi:kinesin family member 1